MPFTCADVQDMAEREVDDVIDNDDVVSYVNSCFLEYTEAFRKTAEQTIVVADADTFYDRTAGHLIVVKITNNGENYEGDWELNHERSKIKIKEKGTFVVESLIIPTEVADINDPVQVHDGFKLGFVKYVAGLFKLQDNDQNPDGLRLLGQADGLIRKASSLLTMPDRRPGQRIPIARSAGDFRNNVNFR